MTIAGNGEDLDGKPQPKIQQYIQAIPSSTHPQPQPHRILHLRRTRPPRPQTTSTPHHPLQLHTVTNRRNKINIRIRRTLPPLSSLLPIPLLIQLPQHLLLSLQLSRAQSAQARFLHTDGWVFAELYATTGVIFEGDDAGCCCSVDSDAGAGGGARHGHVVGGGWG